MIEPIRIEVDLDVMFPSVNCYLVPGESLTLIDCGMESHENWAKLNYGFRENGYKISDLDQIIITHEHKDHIGLLPRLIQSTKAQVYAPRMIQQWFSDPDQARLPHVAFMKYLNSVVGFPEDVLLKANSFTEGYGLEKKIRDIDRFEFYEAGDKLNFGDLEWKILNTPGHCPTQHVFFQEESRQLFSGDALLGLAPMPIVTEDPARQQTPIRALKQVMNSFDRFLEMDLQVVYPGHGPIFNNANELIEKQLKRIAQRKQECLEAVISGRSTIYQIKEEMYPYQETPPDFSGLNMVIGYLDLLEEEGRIRSEKNDAGVFKFYAL